MSINQMPSGGFGRQDVANFSAQFPRQGIAAVATSQQQGLAMPNSNVPPAGAGNPSFPWIGFALLLLGMRVLSHLRRE